jgi:UDP-N-acetylmuramyl pentapeptide phosphotransferase/UDP-N-acetylglucosamine-1-phosphate transferase
LLSARSFGIIIESNDSAAPHRKLNAMAELLFFAEAFLVSYLLTGAILRFSLKRRLLDMPNDRSSHVVPKPRLGGIAITISFYVAFATLLALGFRPFASSTILAGTLGGGAVIAAAGLFDDLRGLDARIKLLIQFAAAALAVASGVVLREFGIPLIGSLDLGPLAVPATILWIVALINFYNFIDGIDGLAAGIGLIASAFFYYISGMKGAAGLQSVYAVIAGSSFGFLRFNFPPARIFMGDTGSTFIGYMFAVLSVVGQGAGIPAFLTILLLGGVIGDAALTLLRRALKKEKLFSPHRTHYYQRLTSLGLSHKQVTLIEYLIAALLGVSAVLAVRAPWVFVTFLSVIWTGFFMWALAKIRSMEKGESMLWKGRTLGVAFGDLAFIAVSYVLSYYLRLNFRLPHGAETNSMLISLPIVVVIRTAVFYSYGLYRSIWRYTTFDDLVRIAKAVSVGSAIMVVSFTLLFRFRSFPRSVFIIDWFILTVFMTGSRVAARWFHELPSREEITGTRVIIAGTGPLAELISRHVKKSGTMHAVGYLDDRAEMAHRMIHGLEVLGPLSDVEEIARRHDAKEIIAVNIDAGRIPPEARGRLAAAGIRVRSVSDPSELDDEFETRDGESPCAGRSVLVAGNGPLVGQAGALFSGASRLTVVSNDGASIEGARRRAGPGGTSLELYFGIAHESAAFRRILALRHPEFVFADFAVPDAGVENAGEAYLKTVLFPLETLATEVVRRREGTLVVIERGVQSVPGDAVRAAELAVLDIFRGDASRAAVVRLERDPGVALWPPLVRQILVEGGGVFRVVAPVGPSEQLRVARCELAGPVPESAHLRLELARLLDDGDAEAAMSVLSEMARLSPVKEHV